MNKCILNFTLLDKFIDGVAHMDFMNKSASIAIIIVGIVVVGVVIVFSSGSFNDRNNSTSTQNNAANTSQDNSGTNAVPSQNTTGKHFTVTLEEQVGVQQK